MAACKEKTPEATTPQSTTPEQTTPEPDAPVVHAKILSAALSNYEIIYAKDSSQEVKDEVKKLVNAIFDSFGVMLNQRSDLFYEGVESLKKGQYEILIGCTNREESETFLNKYELKWSDYGYAIVGDKLVIASQNEDGTLEALRAFIQYVSKNQDNEVFFSNANLYLITDTSFPHPNLTVNGIAVDELSILCNEESLGGVAQIIRDAILRASGIAVPIVTDSEIEKIEGVRYLSPHSCRHTYVSQMQALGIDMETIKSIVGHADLDMTRHYLHVQEPIRQAAVKKLSDAFEENSKKV